MSWLSRAINLITFSVIFYCTRRVVLNAALLLPPYETTDYYPAERIVTSLVCASTFPKITISVHPNINTENSVSGFLHATKSFPEGPSSAAYNTIYVVKGENHRKSYVLINTRSSFANTVFFSKVSMLQCYSEIIHGKLSKVQRLKLIALITVEVHARDVIEKLVKGGCNDASAFEWLCQLRLYSEKVCSDSQATTALRKQV